MKSSEVYRFGDNGRTNKKLRLRHGNYERIDGMVFVSNHDFLNGEFNLNQPQTCIKSSLPPKKRSPEPLELLKEKKRSKLSNPSRSKAISLSAYKQRRGMQ